MKRELYEVALRAWRFLPKVLRLLLGGLLVFSAVAKLHDPSPYLRFVAAMGFTRPLAYATLVGVTAAELGLGLLALLGLYPGGVLRLMAVLFAGFVLVLAYALLRRVGGSCGCFGRIVGVKVGLAEMGRDLVLACLALLAARGYRHQ
ncbi:MAG: DoxX family membrane protein [candidate division KSB1 bacterium]|nr:DoxX family membrane protein [candidate division KSB1 bacterium]